MQQLHGGFPGVLVFHTTGVLRPARPRLSKLPAGSTFSKMLGSCQVGESNVQDWEVTFSIHLVLISLAFLGVFPAVHLRNCP